MTGQGSDDLVPPGVTGYADAVRELEAILAELEHDDIDIDQLAAQVRRAAVLIRFCRSRILEARVEVEQVVADLDAAIVDDGEDLPDEE